MKEIMRLSLFLALLISTKSQAQNQVIDSLSQELNKHLEEDSLRLHLYLQLAESYVYYDRDSMLFYAQKGMALAEELEYDESYLYALQRVGIYYYAQLSLDTAVQIFKRGLKLSQNANYPERESAFLGSLGIAKYAQGSTDSAIYYLEKAFVSDLEQGDTIKMIVRLNNLGAVYLDINKPAESLRSIYKSLKLAIATQNREKAAFAANNMAVIYQRYGGKQKAIQYFEIALAYMQTSNLGRMSLLSNIAELHLSLGQLDSAAYFYRLALPSPREGECDLLGVYTGLLDIHLQANRMDSAAYYNRKASAIRSNCLDSSYLFHYYRMSGRLYRLQGNLSDAEVQFKQALLYGHDGMRSIAYLYQDYALLEEENGNFESALVLTKQYGESLERTHKAQYNRKVVRTDLEVAFAEEKKAMMEDQDSMQRELSYFQDLRVVWAIASLFFSVAIIVLLVSYRRGQKLARGLKVLNTTVLEQKDNLQHKSEQLAVSNEKIRELSEFRERLAAMAVHDMKGPLSTIIGLSDGDMTTSKQRLIKKAGHQMLNFLMDLLDIYKFQKANIALKLLPHSLSSLLEESQQAVNYLAEEKAIKIKTLIPKDLVVPVDDGIVVRVITNIFSNAIKYSPSESEIQVSANTNTNAGRSFLVLKIEDQGKGLSSKELERMFQPLDLRKENYISKSTSTGIGLDFCKLAVQAHRGEIWAESQLGIGTTIFIKLPLNAVVPKDLSEGPSEEELKEHKDFSAFEKELSQLKTLKIHEAGEILPILQILEEAGADQSWISSIKATVYAADAKRFKEILEKALNYDT